MQYRLVTMPSDPAQPNEDVGRPSEFVSDSHEVGTVAITQSHRVRRLLRRESALSLPNLSD
jgi:hypothetical protein